MELGKNSDAAILSTVPRKNVAGKIIISILLGLLPIALSGAVTFMHFPLSGLLTFAAGTIIGLTLIPFMLFITNTDKWTRKWYIWVAMSAAMLIVFVLPIVFMSGAGAAGMQGPMNGDIKMEKGMY